MGREVIIKRRRRRRRRRRTVDTCQRHPD